MFPQADQGGITYYYGPQFEGHREIWLQELDLETKQLKGERYGLWDGAVRALPRRRLAHLPA